MDPRWHQAAFPAIPAPILRTPHHYQELLQHLEDAGGSILAYDHFWGGDGFGTAPWSSFLLDELPRLHLFLLLFSLVSYQLCVLWGRDLSFQHSGKTPWFSHHCNLFIKSSCCYVSCSLPAWKWAHKNQWDLLLRKHTLDGGTKILLCGP